MKKIIICLLIVVSATQFGCKKFLDITPVDKLTGNNFYKSSEDVESNLNDMYGRLFQKYTSTNTAGATGEFRSGEVIPAVQGGGNRSRIALLGGHNRIAVSPAGVLGPQVIAPATTVNDRTLLSALSTGDYNFYALTRWEEFYQVIQSANLLISKLEEGIEVLSAEQTRRYIAECKFIRCYSYFHMVRLYGDVVYYTAAYQKDALPRENMISVIKKCVADMKSGRNDMPWTNTDPTKRGVRASKGAANALIMAMDLWNAGFDFPNKTAYYEDIVDLGTELMNSGAYRLLDLNEWPTVSRGRSEESLFELFSTFNYTSSVSASRYAPFGETFIHFPYRLPEYDFRYSGAVFTTEYMDKLYPDRADGRLAAWFDQPFDQNSETFQLKKFAGNTIIDSTDPNNTANPESTFLILRYADAILMRAEAAAELGDLNQATEMLNIVRVRGLANVFPNATGDVQRGIKDAIFWERAKELMGEGSHYFDLVRTRRILDRQYTDNPLTPDKFSRGAWTWPIDASAEGNNPLMVRNNYWIGSGF
jgi:hypothetical protein